MKWGYFIAAALTATYFLMQAGAPWYAVAGGVLLAGHFNWRRAKRAVPPETKLS